MNGKQQTVTTEATEAHEAGSWARSEMLPLLHAYLESHSDEFEEGEVSKMMGRLSVVDSPECSDKLVFEVERHRACYGTDYVPGRPMASYVTYWPRYVFDPISNSVHAVGNVRRSEFEITLGTNPFFEEFSFDFERQEEGGFEVREGFTKTKATIHDESSVNAVISQIVDGLSFEGDLEVLADALAPDQREECDAVLREAAKKDLMAKAIQSWADAVEDEPGAGDVDGPRGGNDASRKWAA